MNLSYQTIKLLQETCNKKPHEYVNAFGATKW